MQEFTSGPNRANKAAGYVGQILTRQVQSICKDKNKLMNTVLVVSSNSNQVITCYRSLNPFKKIKLKSKKLFSNYGFAA